MISHQMRFSTKPLSMRIEMKPRSEVVSCGPMRIDCAAALARDFAQTKWREEQAGAMKLRKR